MKIYFLLLTFIAFYLNSYSQDSDNELTGALNLTSNSKDSLNNNFNFPGIKKILLPGMSRSQFLDVCAIQWLPLQNADSVWQQAEVNLNKLLKYDEVELFIQKLAVSEIVKACESTLLSEDGRKIYSLEIGKGPRKIVFTAGIHAREVANTHFLLKFTSELVNAYEQREEKVINLLNNYSILMLPCANPDGYAAAIEGIKVIQNKELFFAKQINEAIYTAKSNANGVDINRNFPSYSSSVLWDKDQIKSRFSDREPSLNYFAGFSLGSENETRVVMNFLMNNIPFAYRFFDLHSAGRLVYAGKPHLSDEFNSVCTVTGKIVANHTKYSLLGLRHEESGEGTDGTITDFAAEIASGFVFNEKLGRLAPANTDSLVRKTEEFPYRCSVNTIETLKTSRKEGYGLLRTSTPEMQVSEWSKYKLKELFIKLITE